MVNVWSDEDQWAAGFTQRTKFGPSNLTEQEASMSVDTTALELLDVSPQILNITQDPPLYAVSVVWNGTYTSCLLSGRSHVSHGDS